MDNKILLAYLIYLPVAMLLTLYVARTLFKNGRIFMLDIFKGRAEIADATNKLFEVGFYLVNVGFAMRILRIRPKNGLDMETWQELLEALSYKIGAFTIYLGTMLFLNMFLFFRGRKKANRPKPEPPKTTTPRTVPTVG